MQCGSWVEFSLGFGLLLGGVDPSRSEGWEVSALSSFAAAPRARARVQRGHHHREPHLQDRKGGRAARLGPDARLCLRSEGGGQPTVLTAPTLSLLFVLNKLTLFFNTLCLEIIFQPPL